MSEPQKLAATIPADSKPAKGPADDLAGLSLQRRTLLFGAAAVAAGTLASQASAAPDAPDLSGALAKFRASIPSHFDREYVENAVVPFFLGSIFAGERPILPMIDLPLTKQDAIPWDFWGLLYEDWKPTQMTIDVFEDFLRKVSRDKIVFHNLHQPTAGRVPVGPGAVIDDDIGFSRSA
jgi:hypothetical protein